MRFVISLLSLLIVIGAVYGLGHREAPRSGRDIKPIPLIVEIDEGEHRVRRPRDLPMPTPYFTIKVDRENGGSQKMWLVAEEIPPGGVIARHKHLDQDEILLIQSGSGHAWLGTEERDVHSGAVIFIPSNTWAGFKNTGKEIVKVVAVFSDPGYDEFMRCSSVPQGGQPDPITPGELLACQYKDHVVAEGAFDSATTNQTRPK